MLHTMTRRARQGAIGTAGRAYTLHKLPELKEPGLSVSIPDNV